MNSGHDDVALHTALAFVSFCLVASGTYCLNDARDAEADRAHPTKRRRPVAAGEISVVAAVTLGAVLLAGGLAVAAAVRWQLLLVVGSYVAVQVAYSWRLKEMPVFDIAAVASGFVLTRRSLRTSLTPVIERATFVACSFCWVLSTKPPSSTTPR